VPPARLPLRPVPASENDGPASPLRGAELTAEKLLEAAHELLYERVGGRASVSEICARAHVNVAMVSYCFGGKDELLDALLERVVAQATADLERLSRLELGPSEQLRLHMAEMIRNYVRYPYVNRLLNERLSDAKREPTTATSRLFALPARDWYRRLLAEGQAVEGWREVDPTLFFFSVVGICEFLFSGRAWLEQAFGEELDGPLVERYVEHATQLVLGGLLGGATPPGHRP
jgi:AcrR family transcriptional regulator